MSNTTDDSLSSILSTSPDSPVIKPTVDLYQIFFINDNNYAEKTDEIFSIDLINDCCFSNWRIDEESIKELSIYFKNSKNTKNKIRVCNKFIDNCNIYSFTFYKLSTLKYFLISKL